MSAISRNARCPCGSGKKYKKCCLGKRENESPAVVAHSPIIVTTDLDDLSNRANDLIRQGEWEEAGRLCRRLQEEFPEELDAEDRLAQLYQAKGDYPQALLHAKAALDKACGNPDKFSTELVADLAEQVAFLGKQVAP